MTTNIKYEDRENEVGVLTTNKQNVSPNFWNVIINNEYGNLNPLNYEFNIQ